MVHFYLNFGIHAYFLNFEFENKSLKKQFSVILSLKKYKIKLNSKKKKKIFKNLI